MENAAMRDRIPVRMAAQSLRLPARVLGACAFLAGVAIGGRLLSAADRPASSSGPGPVRLGTARLREGGVIRRVAFSTEGEVVASVGADQGPGDVSLWDAATGRLAGRVATLGTVWDFAFLPSGEKLVSVGPGGLSVWELERGRMLRRIPVALRSMRSLSLAPAGGLVFVGAVVGHGGGIVDLGTGQLRYEIKEAESGVFSPDGKLLAATGRTSAVFSSTIDPTGPGPETHLGLYEVATGRRIRRLTGHSPVLLPAFSPCGRLLAWQARGKGSATDLIELMDVSTGKVRRRLRWPRLAFFGGGGSAAIPAALAFSPEAKSLAAPCGDGWIRLWDLATGSEIRRLASFARQLVFSPDGRTLAAADDHVIQLWDLATGKRRLGDAPNQAPITAMCFSPDGKAVATVAEDKVLRLWDAATGDAKAALTGHAFTPRSVAFGLCGRKIVTTADDRTVRVWDPDAGAVVSSLALPRGCPKFAAFLNGGRRVCVAADPSHFVWEAVSGKTVRSWGTRLRGVLSADVAPCEGLLAVAAGTGHTVAVWRASSGAKLFSFETPRRERVRGVRFTGLGDLLVCLTEQKLSLWETSSGRQLSAFDRPSRVLLRDTAMAVSPDGRLVAVMGGPRSISLVSTLDGKEIGRLPAGRGWVSALAFSPDGRALASACSDTTALVWDVAGFYGRVRTKVTPAGVSSSDAIWPVLCRSDAVAAQRMMWQVIALGDRAVPAIVRSVEAVPSPDPAAVAGLIADLDSAKFHVRETASARLGVLGDAVAPALEKALLGDVSAEARQRLKGLLSATDTELAVSGPRAGALRALSILHRIGTPEANRALAALARRPLGASFRRRAAAASRLAASRSLTN